jgi:hypothetical protein
VDDDQPQNQTDDPQRKEWTVLAYGVAASPKRGYRADS